MPPETLRACREALTCSQAAFAAELGVSPDTYRVWDAGRRPTPIRILDRARVLVTHQNDQQPLPLRILATMIGVHVRTLRNAARDGRLAVTYDTRTTFRRLRGYATPADARAFRQFYYGKSVRAEDRRAPLAWSAIPLDYDVRIRTVRRGLSLSQAQFAERVGAARQGGSVSVGSTETLSVTGVLATHRAVVSQRSLSRNIRSGSVAPGG